jgi:hypothetical protein
VVGELDCEVVDTHFLLGVKLLTVDDHHVDEHRYSIEISHQVGNHDQGSQKHDLVDVLDQDAEVGYGEDEVDKEYYIVLDLHLQLMGLFFYLPWLAWMYIDIVDPHRCITHITTLFDESIK